MAKKTRNIPKQKGASPKLREQAQTTILQALALHRQGQLAQAQSLYEKVLNVIPGQFDCLHLLGVIAYQTERHEDAVELIAKAIAANPHSAEAHVNLGLALRGVKRLDEALASCDKALALKPGCADAHYIRGNTLKELRRLDDALADYDRALALKPGYADAYYNRGNTLEELHRLDDALASYDSALALKPDHTEAHNNRGIALRELRRLDEALASCDNALALKPDYADGYNNRGITLKELHRLDEALADYDSALALKPDYAEAYNNRGVTLKELRRLDEALASYDKAIVLKPEYAEAYNNRGNTLRELKRWEDAVVSYGKALELKPEYEFLRGTLLFTTLSTCDWRGLSEKIRVFEADIHSLKKSSPPFSALVVVDSPELHKKAAMMYAEALYPRGGRLGRITKRAWSDKIRIGYFSADFHNHATAYLMAELFETHDPSRFELFGFSFGPDKQDEMRRRVSSAFTTFVDVRDRSDGEVARYSRELGIDIAVDLKGYTQDSRPGIFAQRSAPIQVNYLGYPGTMGADYMDYVIADRTVIPRERESDYTEKVVCLPHSYQVNDSKRKISPRLFTRAELGLPDSGFVFCCFNNSYKILPATFDRWMRMLTAVKGSVLWLIEDNPSAVQNLRKEAEARGVDSCRLLFAGRIPLDEHLARQKFADLFLDTLPYNAHTTASDALWGGLPVLTCRGESFAGRVAASLLTAIDLPELITCTEYEYEARAIELALDVERLSEIKRKLERNKRTAPLFDAKSFTVRIEAAYQAMYDRYQADLAPEGMEIT